MKATKTQAATATTLRPGPQVRAAIYVRISHDRTGAGLGIARQEEDCRALCARKGWAVAGVYADNDVSAYARKPRPEWTRLAGDIQRRGGDRDRVLACGPAHPLPPGAGRRHRPGRAQRRRARHGDGGD